MYISYHQIPGSKVYDSDGHLITRLTRLLIDPDNGRILALETTLKGPHLLSPQDILSWKRHYLTLGQQYEFHSPADLVRVQKLLKFQQPFLIGKKVRTENGTFLGTVQDFSIDTNRFILASISVQKRIFLWKKQTLLIHQSQIVEIKSEEIIVKDTLVTLPVRQNSLGKFGLRRSPTLDQALCEPVDHTSP